MRRLVKIAGIVLGAVIVVVAALFVFLNTQPGLNVLASLVEPVTGGKVAVRGLSGHFPNALRAQQIVLRDDKGPWARFENVVVDGSVLGLAGNHLDADRLSASRVQVLRLPMSSDGGSALKIDIGMLDIPDLETSAAVSGRPMMFAASGAVHMNSLDDVAADLTVMQSGGGGTYRFQGAIENGVVNGNISASEQNNGLIAGTLGLNGIGPIMIQAHATGPKGANRVTFTMDAGPLHAAGNGTLDLPGERADADFSVNAPAMQLRPDLSWQSLMANGHMQGTFDAPNVNAMVMIEGLELSSASVDRISGTVTGSGGGIDLDAQAAGVNVNGVDSTILAGAPVALQAHVDLKAQGRPVTFHVAHPVIAADGRLDVAGMIRGNANIALKRLKPFAARAGIDLEGAAQFTANVTETSAGYEVAANGAIDATGGDRTIAGLLGPHAPVAFAGSIGGSNITIRNAELKGAAGGARVTGAIRGDALDLALTAAIPDVAKVASGVIGSANIRATVKGPANTAQIAANATGNIGTSGFAPQPVSLTVTARGLSKPMSGSFDGQGAFRNAPVNLSGTFAWAPDALKLAVEHGDWKSLTLNADVTIPQNGPLQAKAMLHMASLADLADIIGAGVTGSLDAALDYRPDARSAQLGVQATAHNVSVQGTDISALRVTGDVEDPLGTPSLALAVNADGFAAAGFSGTAAGTLGGTLTAPAVKLSANLKDNSGRPAAISGNAVYEKNGGAIALNALTLDYRNIRATLAAPTRIAVANGIAVDNLVLRSGQARLSVNGRLAPQLDAKADLANVTAALFRPFIPDITQGSLTGSADLRGTLQAPRGSIQIDASDLRVLGMPASVASGRLNARADLNGRGAAIDASLALGSSKLAITGDAPLAADERFNLKLAGDADLSLLNAELTAEGRKLLGTATIDAAVTGTMASPVLSGGVRLANGEFQDFPRGLRLTDVAANAQLRGNSIQLVNLTARAGTGTISGSGTVDLSAPGIPLDLKIQARDAQPVTSDLLRASIDADVTVSGTATKRMLVGGKITIRRGESILPSSFPPTVATLNVVQPGAAEQGEAETSEPATIALDLDISSPGRFFVRGRGLDAEVEGDVHLGGTIDSLNVTGGFTLRRGTFDLAGETLNFTSGKLTFEGASLRNRLDPALDFVAESTSGSFTAKLEITGTVSNPKIQLTSTPMMPQDEILSQLLFQQSVKQLSPFQLAEMAQAAAALGGFGGGLNPLASVRRTLGLDRLAISTGPDNQTAVEAGKYIARNVYVGAKQGLSNTTQAEVQVDITKNLKLKGTATTGTSATVTQGAQQTDLGNSIGLSYQFEY